MGITDDEAAMLRLAVYSLWRLEEKGVASYRLEFDSSGLLSEGLHWLSTEHEMLYGQSFLEGWDSTRDETMNRLMLGERRAKWPIDPVTFVSHLAWLGDLVPE